MTIRFEIADPEDRTTRFIVVHYNHPAVRCNHFQRFDPVAHGEPLRRQEQQSDGRHHDHGGGSISQSEPGYPANLVQRHVLLDCQARPGFEIAPEIPGVPRRPRHALLRQSFPDFLP